MDGNDRYTEAVKRICEDYLEELSNSGLVPGSYIDRTKEDIRTKISPLLMAPKPKIMVYGIYNSGKSTLVNAICGKRVAEVADRPMTDQVTEYDEGKYILIDSPGVNAPIQHEEIADSHLSGCHVILFVISSKGIFEDRVNYEKMWELIKKEIPFFIILNDRGTNLPKEKGELREKARKEHERELNEIKRKIIKNLIIISKRQDIGEKYDVIVLNAKRAWTGIEKSKQALIESSQLFVLTSRIDQILEGKGALKQLLAPLSVIDEMISSTERLLLTQTGNEDFAIKRETLQKRISLFQETFLSSVRTAVEKQFEILYNSRLGNIEIDENQVWEDVCLDVSESYRSQILPLSVYMKNAFPKLGLAVDDLCDIRRADHVEDSEPVTDSYTGQRSSAGTLRGQRQGSSMAIPERKEIGFIDMLINPLINLLKSREQKEKEEMERLYAEAESYNREAEQRVEENIRRRQDARTWANTKINEMACEIRLQLSDSLDDKFRRNLQILDDTIKENSQKDTQIKKTIQQFKQLHSSIFELRRNIS